MPIKMVQVAICNSDKKKPCVAITLGAETFHTGNKKEVNELILRLARPK